MFQWNNPGEFRSRRNVGQPRYGFHSSPPAEARKKRMRREAVMRFVAARRASLS
ncbi:hypothetical protein [Xenophilus sp.]|uniref:hypothetical protein n=1 Tax=Xenophilus sp. TaxID=1873499 RepID=UPI0037DCDA22